MKFSIVTISYNQGRFLEQAIRSVVEQDYDGDVEYIVVDPGSTDSSREIIERYRDRIAAVVFEPDLGPADGLNKGFARATGYIYGYLNADDYLLPDALNRVSQYFSERDVEVASGNALIVDTVDRVRRHHYSDRFDLKAYAYGQAQIMQASTFIRADAFRRVGGFNARNRTSWDGELLVDLGLSGARFGNIDDCLSAFRVYPESITGSGRLRHLFAEDHKRLFVRIMGRGARPYDTVIRNWLRVRKHWENPRNFIQRALKGPVAA